MRCRSSQAPFWWRKCLSIVVALHLAASQAYALAPTSLYQTTDESIVTAADMHTWIARIAAIVHEEEKAHPGEDQALDRLKNIGRKIHAYLLSENGDIVWKHAFHTPAGDYFDFTIGGERYVWCYRQWHLGDAESEPLETLAATAACSIKPQNLIPRETVGQYSNDILNKAVSEGHFFAVNDMLRTDINALLSGKPQDMAKRFAQALNVSPRRRDAIAVKMVSTLSNKENLSRLRGMFRKLKKTAAALQKQGVQDLDKRKIAVILGNGPTPLMYVRTEAGQPVNILAHSGKKNNSIYFSLDALEDYYRYPDPMQTVGAILRTENAYLAGKDEPFTDKQREIIAGLTEKILQRGIRANAERFSKLERELLQVIEDSEKDKSKSERNVEQIKRNIQRKIRRALGPIPLQWHLIERSDGLHHFLFSIPGKRFYIAYDPVSEHTSTRFIGLEKLYDRVWKTVQSVLPDAVEKQEVGPGWDGLIAKLEYLAAEYRARLSRRGRRAVANLLDYAASMDHSNGYLDMIRSLTSQLEEADMSVPGSVPDVFQEKPLEKRDFVVLQVVTGPRRAPAKAGQTSPPMDPMEISAIRYRDMKVLEKFHAFVQKPKEISQEAWKKTAKRKKIPLDELEEAPECSEVLKQLREFLGDAPIFTHGNTAKNEELKELFAREPEGPISNQFVDTLALARKVMPTSEEKQKPDFHLKALPGQLGLVAPEKDIRGLRLLRIYHWVVEELALLAKKMASKGQRREYLKLLGRFDPTFRMSALKHFEKAKEEFGNRVMHVPSWERLRGAIDMTDPEQGGIQVLVLDFDNTIARSKGWVGSDDWFRWENKFLELYGGKFYELLDAFNRFLTGIGFFELMEPEIPDIIRAAQAKGIKVVVLTARNPWKGAHKDLLSNCLAKMKIDIKPEDIVMCGNDSGTVDKAGGLAKFFESPRIQRMFGEKFPRAMYLDDGAHYLEKLGNHPTVGPAMQKMGWYDGKIPELEQKDYDYFEKLGFETLEKNPASPDVLCYFLNAFAAANDKAVRKEAIEVGKRVLEASRLFRGDVQLRQKFQKLLADYVKADPDFRQALVTEEIVAKGPQKNIIFKTLFEEIQNVWGDIGLDTPDTVRYIMQDPLFRDKYDTYWDPDPRTLVVRGMKILRARAPTVEIMAGPRDRAEFSGGTLAAQRAILRKLETVLGPEIDMSLLRKFVEALRSDQVRDLFAFVLDLPDDPTFSGEDPMEWLMANMPDSVEAGRRALPSLTSPLQEAA